MSATMSFDQFVSGLYNYIEGSMANSSIITQQWGEMPVLPDSGIAAIEREQMTKLRPMEVEGPRLHQPSSRHHPQQASKYARISGL